MRDGRTARQTTRREPPDLEDFLERFDVTLVGERGASVGAEHALDRPKLVIGRGPDVDLRFEDAEISFEHALIEFTGSGFRVRDLGSTNGTRVNGAAVQAHDLENGDRLELGKQALRLRVETRPRTPRTYCLPDD